jgi:drug/metabolite transporter (DMT)-like permease
LINQKNLQNLAKIDNAKLKKLAAFSVIYFIWGTTYLAIRLAIETIPPFLMAGMRFTIAGLLFYGWCYQRFDQKPNLTDWRKAAIPGILMFVLGNGTLTWSEQFIPSGLAALIISTLPIWMVLLDWLFARGKKPDIFTMAGIGLGISGVAMLSGVDNSVLINSGEYGGSVVLGIFMLTFAAISWAAGSIYARNSQSSVALQFTISMQILVGGLVLTLIGLIHGEWSELHMHDISLLSIFSMSYLIFFGTLLAFSAYIWLLRTSTPAKVGTYAFFNPLIAVFLGWFLVDEPLTSQTLLGAGCILLSLLLVNQSKLHQKIPAVDKTITLIINRIKTSGMRIALKWKKS